MFIMFVHLMNCLRVSFQVHVSLNSIMKNAIYATQTDISNILSLYNSTATVFKSPGP